MERKSPDIVVGLIDVDLNIISQNNIEGHEQLSQKYPHWLDRECKPWRYNAATRDVYWYKYKVPTQKEKDEVANEINKKYPGFYGIRHHTIIDTTDTNDFKKFALAHGSDKYN